MRTPGGVLFELAVTHAEGGWTCDESPKELVPYCEMPWRVALENIKDVKEFYLDIPGFSPGTVEAKATGVSGSSWVLFQRSTSMT